MQGADEMRRKLQEFAQQYPRRVGTALYREAQLIMTEAKHRCPVAQDGGTLRASGMVSEPQYVDDDIIITLSFGGAAMPYAIAVHEHLSEHSPPSWVKAEQSGHGIHWTTPGTGPKFLEGPLNEALVGMLDRLATRLKL
jgi:hypothetical protein